MRPDHDGVSRSKGRKAGFQLQIQQVLDGLQRGPVSCRPPSGSRPEAGACRCVKAQSPAIFHIPALSSWELLHLITRRSYPDRVVFGRRISFSPSFAESLAGGGAHGRIYGGSGMASGFSLTCLKRLQGRAPRFPDGCARCISQPIAHLAVYIGEIGKAPQRPEVLLQIADRPFNLAFFMGGPGLQALGKMPSLVKNSSNRSLKRIRRPAPSVTARA